LDVSAWTTVVVDFYDTVAEDAAPVPALWEDLVALGYRGHPELQAMFEPDAFDGSLTPAAADEPQHQEWLLENWRRMLVLCGVPDKHLGATLDHLLTLQRRWSAKASPGAVDFITLLRDHGYKVALCSNWEDDIAPYLSQAGLPSFDAVVTSAEVGARKPHRRIFEEVLARVGSRPEDCVFVGDNWDSDIVGALRVGMAAVWLRRDRATRGLFPLVAEFDSILDLREEFAGRLRERGLA